MHHTGAISKERKAAMAWQVLTDGLTYGGGPPFPAKVGLAHGGPGGKVGPGEIKIPLQRRNSPPSEKLFLRATCVI